MEGGGEGKSALPRRRRRPPAQINESIKNQAEMETRVGHHDANLPLISLTFLIKKNKHFKESKKGNIRKQLSGRGGGGEGGGGKETQDPGNSIPLLSFPCLISLILGQYIYTIYIYIYIYNLYIKIFLDLYRCGFRWAVFTQLLNQHEETVNCWFDVVDGGEVEDGRGWKRARGGEEGGGLSIRRVCTTPVQINHTDEKSNAFVICVNRPLGSSFGVAPPSDATTCGGCRVTRLFSTPHHPLTHQLQSVVHIYRAAGTRINRQSSVISRRLIDGVAVARPDPFLEWRFPLGSFIRPDRTICKWPLSFSPSAFPSSFFP